MKTQNVNFNYFLNGHRPDNGRVKLALDDIKKSGLSFETLEKAGIRLFSGDSDLLKKRLSFSSLNDNNILSVAVLMEIPYRDADGNIIKYEYRLYPETDERKYLHPLHSSPVPYILSDVWAIKDKANKPLYITEGVKKVLKLLQHGKYVIGLSGVWGFRAGKDDGSLFNRELESFTWRGRTVYLAFDDDLWTNPQVRKALYELGLHLTARGALVYICTWKGEKGIDDYLAGKAEPEKELSEIEDKAKPLISFIAPEHRDDVLYALSKTIDTMDELTRESTVTAISKRLNLKPKSIYRSVLKDLVDKEPVFSEEEKARAIKLLKSPTLIKDFLDICHARYIGREKTLLLVKLATMTRHLPRGLSVVLLGTSSVGKSFLIETVLKTTDPTATENFSRTSAQYLLYRKEPLDHKIITFYEFNGADSSSAILRTALTEGELHLGTVQKDASGSLCATEIRKETEGLVILSTYTGSRIDAELSTRVLLQEITHDGALAREVYRRKAAKAEDNSNIFRIWQIADSLIEARPVDIPFLSRLADIFPTKEERFHRDYDKTVMLIKASALLHQYQRQQDKDGAVIATEEDYRLVYSLGDAFAQSLLPVSEPVLRMLDIVKSLEKPTRSELQEAMGVSDASIKRYITQALKADLIDTDGRGEKQVITVVDVPMVPTVLPEPERIFLNDPEPVSQTVEKTDVSGVETAQTPVSQCEPNDLIPPECDTDSSNGSSGSNDAEPSKIHIPSQSTLDGSTDQIKDDDVFVHDVEDGTSSVVPEQKQGKKFNLTNENVDWAKYTWNPVTGCKHGCSYCYARDIAMRFTGHFNPEFHEDRLLCPYNTKADNSNNRVFLGSMADLFGEWVPKEWIQKIIDICRDTPRWTYLCLTKNPKRYLEFTFPDNIWLGMTCDTERRYFQFYPIAKRLRQKKNNIIFVSFEPLKERIRIVEPWPFDWIIIGGQSKTSGEPEFQPEKKWVEEIQNKAKGIKCPVYCKFNLKVDLVNKPKEYPIIFHDEVDIPNVEGELCTF